MSSGKEGSFSLQPQPVKNPPSFQNLFGSSYYNKDANQYGFNLTPENQAYGNQLTALRNSILSELGITSPQREASLNQWQDTFNKEALRTSMPQLENTLFGRGMGGSRLYGDAVTDLLSKVATSGVLNKQTMADQDEAKKLSYLSFLSPELANLSGQGSALMGATTEQGNKDYVQEWQNYINMLPYTATYDNGGGTDWGSMGNLLGTGLGALLAAPTGGMSMLAGAGLGGMLGGGVGGMFGGGGNSGGLDLSTLAGLFGTPGNTSLSNNPLYSTRVNNWNLSNPF